MSLNTLIEEKFQSKLSVVAWITTSHVGKIEINSIDLHTQKTWSTIFPDILGLVVQLNEDRSKIGTFDYYALTRQGSRKLNQCKKPENQIHNECNKKSFYKSCMDYVKFTDGPLEVIHDIFEIPTTL